MRKLLYILIPIIFIVLMSCTVVVEPTGIIELPTEIVEEIIEEIPMELKPIKLYSNYVATPAGIYGINQSVLEKLILEDTKDQEHLFNVFFLKDGEIFFNIKYMISGDSNEAIEKIQYFKQTEDGIVEIETSDFPTPPISDYIEFEGGNYKIIKYYYRDDDGVQILTSRVSQFISPEMIPVAAYLRIDGYSLVTNGLWFSVGETFETRLEGIYFWPVGGSPRRVLKIGRIY